MNGECKYLCKTIIGCYSTIAQIKQSVIFELGLNENEEMKLYGYRGCGLVSNLDISSLPNNYIIFVVLKGIIIIMIGEEFNNNNYLVPYIKIKPLGEV